MAGFLHQVFLSYAAEDVVLATRLEADLVAKGVTVFRDKTKLQPGAEWEEQLEKAVEGSQHLIVLWSKHAKDSDWVNEERTRFVSFKRTYKGAEERNIFPIFLDSTYELLKKYHGFPEIMEAGLYPDGMTTPAANDLWKTIVKEIAESVAGHDPFYRVPVVTVALTEPLIARSHPVLAVPPPAAIDLPTFLANHGIASVAALENRYGKEPHGWKPFGGNGSTVEEILDVALNEPVTGINARIAERGGRQIRWKWFDLMNSDFQTINTDVSRITNRPLVLLIDPISLCNTEVLARYAQFAPWVEKEDTIVALIPPYEARAEERNLQAWIRQKAAPLLDGYFDPPPRSSHYAEHIVRASDDRDVSRVIKLAICRHPEVLPAPQRPPNPYIHHIGG